MGVVYEGTHAELGTPVAIKVLRRELLDSPEFVARFENEAVAALSLRSEHVVRGFDAGRSSSGVPFLVMERLEGLDLHAVLEACGSLAPGVAVDYVLEVCVGLQDVHAAGLIHRDVKPSNLFLTRGENAERRVKILDLGVCKWSANTRARDELTGPSTLLGSPSYASPEQLKDSSAVDERTDVWSLGVVLFELLTGQGPFARRNLAETCAAVLVGVTPALRANCPRAGRGLERVVERCLQKDRDRRYSSVRELANALREAHPRRSHRVIERSLDAASAAPSPAGGPVERTEAQTLASTRRECVGRTGSRRSHAALGETQGGKQP